MRRLRVSIGVAAALVTLASCADSAGTQPAAPPESRVGDTPPTTNPDIDEPADGATLVESDEPTVDSTDDDPTVDSTDDESTASVDRVEPEGYELVAATVTEPDGTVCELCLWLAETSEQRARGLMSVTDLGGADGMAFVYPAPHTGSFWMKNTLLPLSIAFYDAAGRHLEAFDMQPCTSDPCPSYPTPAGFVIAVEVEQGDLSDVGMVPDSVLELLDESCELV